MSPAPVDHEPLRIALFTDTLGDINGVCRFIQNTASHANQTGRDLRVYTCTRFAVPTWKNILNFTPRFATAMPGYANLELVLPPTRAMVNASIEQRPHVIHVSTPGPVGQAGLKAARLLGVPVLGVYHTDFPAYIDKLFDDQVCTWLCVQHMKRIYRRFATIFTRSEDYREALDRLGIPRTRMETLRPGIDIEAFHVRHANPSIWNTQPGVDPAAVKVLYCGRISIEKNMPLLVDAWKLTHATLSAEGVKAQLIIIGDGPYRGTMQRELADQGACFLGFKHGAELSALYASADFFVFPSATDTLGQVVMESQSSGLPVLVTDQGGPKEVVLDGRTGFVLPADDPAVWFKHIQALIQDPFRRREMGAAARRFMQDFSFRASFDHYWSVHERVARQSGDA